MFRSRLAEAYLNSLELDDITVHSSGTIAAATQTEAQLLDPYAANILAREGILQYASPHWNQLTKERLEDHKGITVIFGRICMREVANIGTPPVDARIWDITDISEYESGLGHPLVEADRLEYADLVYEQIVAKINDLVIER